MGFLRRIFDGGRTSGDDEATTSVDDDGEAGSVELDVLRAEAERMDELAQRQLKYAEYAWQPPDQGGERRADEQD